MQASIEHVFPVRFGLDEFVSLVSELVIALSIVATASGDGGAQLNGLVRIPEANLVHSGAVVVSEAHEGVLRNGEIIKLLNFEILPCVLIDGGSVEEAAGHIAMVGLAQLEQVPLGLAHFRVVSFASREIALMFELLEAGHIECGGMVEALVSLDTRDAPVVVVVAVVPSVAPVSSVVSPVVMAAVMMTMMTVVAVVAAPSVVMVFVVFGGSGFRRRG